MCLPLQHWKQYVIGSELSINHTHTEYVQVYEVKSSVHFFFPESLAFFDVLEKNANQSKIERISLIGEVILRNAYILHIFLNEFFSIYINR